MYILPSFKKISTWSYTSFSCDSGTGGWAIGCGLTLAIGIALSVIVFDVFLPSSTVLMPCPKSDGFSFMSQSTGSSVAAFFSVLYKQALACGNSYCLGMNEFVTVIV